MLAIEKIEDELFVAPKLIALQQNYCSRSKCAYILKAIGIILENG
jgi:hypothetical protein